MTPAPTIIKALVIRAPWCFEILTGDKPIEYRSWGTSHRGPLLICAAKQTDSGEYAGKGICVVQLKNVRRVGEKDFEWDLADPRAIVPVPVAGRLGLFDVSVPLDYDFEFVEPEPVRAKPARIVSPKAKPRRHLGYPVRSSARARMAR